MITNEKIINQTTENMYLRNALEYDWDKIEQLEAENQELRERIEKLEEKIL